ncbi:MAG: sigma-70 family RNA polymerase sigma factor [Lentimicrobiaceae bacterium]|jgi:RNA polymerase sigma-70 factor (ECF subfamily)
MTAVEFQYKLISLQEPLMRFAHSLTANEDDAKDLVQETFLKALKYYDTFVHETNFKGWICTIMRNTYINEYRRSFRYIIFRDNSKSEQSQNEVHASGSDDPNSIYRSKELEHIINSLHDDLRLPFKMHQEGFRYKEIAESLRMNIGTVKSRIFVARRKMMKQLN